MGLLVGLRMLKDKGFYNCIVGRDSKTVISWEKGGERGLMEIASLY